MKRVGHKAILIPESLSQYFPRCARANENLRVDLISLGSAYAFGNNGQKTNGTVAMWAWTMAEFADEAYYNEIGKEPLSTAASNYLGIQMTLFFDSLHPFKRFCYRKLMGLMDFYLKNCYYKQPGHLFLLFGNWCGRRHKGFINDVVPEMLFWLFLFIVAVVLTLIF